MNIDEYVEIIEKILKENETEQTETTNEGEEK